MVSNMSLMNVNIYEVNYSVSPGGVDQWEMTIDFPKYTAHFGEFESAPQALEFAMKHLPTSELCVNIKSLEWYEYREAKEANANN
jgi:hypothetical protein